MRDEHKQAFVDIVSGVGGFRISDDGLTAEMGAGSLVVTASVHVLGGHHFFKVVTQRSTPRRGVESYSEDASHENKARFKFLLKEGRDRVLAHSTGGA